MVAQALEIYYRRFQHVCEMTEYPEVAVVILNWNGRRWLEKFLPSVLATAWPNLRIVVGDNASDDDSVTFLQTHFPEAELVPLDQNYGFAAGYNRVLEQVTSTYFVLLNSDVEVTPGWIHPVIGLMERDLLIAAAQPKILAFAPAAGAPDRFEYAGAAGGYLDRYGYPFCRGRIFGEVEADTGQYDTATEVFWATGAALFIRRSAWIVAGGFDGRFFAHMEEIDLCWRLKNRGYRIFCCPESIVRHVGGGTLDAAQPYKTYLNFRNSLYMLKKNLPVGKAGGVIFTRHFLDFLSLLAFVLQGRFAHAREISRAHWDYIRHSGDYAPFRGRSARRNAAGWYAGSIVWDYFGRKKKHFSDLRRDRFL